MKKVRLYGGEWDAIVQYLANDAQATTLARKAPKGQGSIIQSYEITKEQDDDGAYRAYVMEDK